MTLLRTTRTTRTTNQENNSCFNESDPLFLNENVPNSNRTVEEEEEEEEERRPLLLADRSLFVVSRRDLFSQTSTTSGNWPNIDTTTTATTTTTTKIPKNSPSIRLETLTMASSSSTMTSRWCWRWWPWRFQTKNYWWFPGPWDIRDVVVVPPPGSSQDTTKAVTTIRVHEPRSVQRRLFLFLTEPDTSIGSTVFFVILMVAILTMNGIMVLQTLPTFQYTPDQCDFCNDSPQPQPQPDQADHDDWICVCPPESLRWTVVTLDYLVAFFAVEWILRVVCFVPPPHQKCKTWSGRLGQWIKYVFWEWTQVLDFWATFPYYLEFISSRYSISSEYMTFRLLRLFRVFQVVRLGSYNVAFHTIIAVFQKAAHHLRILLLLLTFGAALFGSVVFWLEKGTWQYWPPTGRYEFVRFNGQHQLEISPFDSIPTSFYWFLVTATTVGYGDIYPTSHLGRLVAVFAMIAGVLVIAFPVGVFTDLMAKELQKQGALLQLDENNNNNNNHDNDDLDFSPPKQCDDDASDAAAAIHNSWWLGQASRNVRNEQYKTKVSSPDYPIHTKTHHMEGDEQQQQQQQQQQKPQENKEWGDEEQPLLSNNNNKNNDNNIVNPTKESMVSGSFSEARPQQQQPPPVFHRVDHLESWYGATTQTSPPLPEMPAEDIIAIAKLDWVDLLFHLQTIQQSQERMEAILKKYHLTPKQDPA